MKNVSNLDEIKTDLLKQWDRGELLNKAVREPQAFFEYKIKWPSMSFEKFGEYIKLVEYWRQAEQIEGITVDKVEKNYNKFGRQSLPFRLRILSVAAGVQLLHKERELNNFIKERELIIEQWNELAEWTITGKNGFKVLEKRGKWSKIIAVMKYLREHQSLNKYLREIELPDIDTKFIEKNFEIVKELAGGMIAGRNLKSKTEFNEFFAIKRVPEQFVNIRFLDTQRTMFGMKEVSVPVGELKNWKNDFQKIFITENKTNFYAFPNKADSMVMFGGGYGVRWVKEINWLNQKQVYYWGDIDTHGFSILNMVRCYVPGVKSFLMDFDTIEEYKAFRDNEADDKRTTGILDNLTVAEQEVYQWLLSEAGRNFRLEQELIGFNYVEKIISKL